MSIVFVLSFRILLRRESKRASAAVRNLSQTIVKVCCTCHKLSFQISFNPESSTYLQFQFGFGALMAGRPRLRVSRGASFLRSWCRAAWRHRNLPRRSTQRLGSYSI